MNHNTLLDFKKIKLCICPKTLQLWARIYCTQVKEGMFQQQSF